MSVPREETRASPAAWIASSWMAAAAEVGGERGPSAGGVSDAPLPYGRGGDAALAEVGGCPAAGELADVERFGVQQDGLDPGVGFGSEVGRGSVSAAVSTFGRVSPGRWCCLAGAGPGSG